MSCASVVKSATESIYVSVYFGREGLMLLGKQQCGNQVQYSAEFSQLSDLTAVLKYVVQRYKCQVCLLLESE